MAEKHREEGNKHFQEGKFPDAMTEYNEAIRRNPDDVRLYSNRAACYMKLLEFPTALLDIERGLKMDPNFIKLHIRKANCHFMMKEYHKALDTF